MKRNAIFLVVVIAVIFGLFPLAWGVCPEQPNDRGACDTLNVNCLNCNTSGTGPYFIKFPLLVSHDQTVPGDSIAGFVIPLTWTRTNPSAYCSLGSYWNTNSVTDLSRSIFQHIVEGADTLYHNRMADLKWGSRILDLSTNPPHFYMWLLPTQSSDQGWWEGNRILLATLTFKIQDTMQVCIDTTFWPPNSRLAFYRSDTVSYIPRHNLPHCFDIKVTLGPGSISGTKFNDVDGDCVQDPGEQGLPGWMITLTPGWLAALTDGNGNYSFSDIATNTYTINEVRKPYWEQTCPAPPGNYVVTLESGQTVTGKDFGNRALVNIQDLSVDVAGGPARPGFQKLYGISYQNKGHITNGTVILTLPPEVIHSESSPGGVYDDGNNSVTWDVGALDPGFIGWLWTSVLVPDTVTLGTILTSSVRIEPIVSDTTPADNTDTERQTVRGSYDPNEKLVTPQGVIFRSDTLRYQINFQNVGTDTAFNIVVRDTLGSNLDITTIESGASIHPYMFNIAGRELSWTFANINLPDSTTSEPKSHGFVSFRVRPISDALLGTDIQNRAAIYFDFNPPVITNTVHSIIYLCGDVNRDDLVDVGDVVYLINYLFKGGTSPNPNQTGDVTRDGVVDVGDVVFLINYLFKGGSSPCS